MRSRTIIVFWVSFFLIFFPIYLAQAQCVLKSDGSMRDVGTIIYNKSWDVLQVCAGDQRWKALSAYDTSSTCLLNRKRVRSGQSHIFYTVEEDEDCSLYAQVRNCVDKSFDGDPAYKYASCTSPEACKTGPLGSPCSDGAIYIGNHPDSGHRLYVSPENDSEDIPWNNGLNNWVDTSMTNCSGLEGSAESCADGWGNTSILYNLGTSPSPAPYQASRLCWGKGEGWYLPSIRELKDVIFFEQGVFERA